MCWYPATLLVVEPLLPAGKIGRQQMPLNDRKINNLRASERPFRSAMAADYTSTLRRKARNFGGWPIDPMVRRSSYHAVHIHQPVCPWRDNGVMPPSSFWLLASGADPAFH